jgi:hypothetical protein
MPQRDTSFIGRSRQAHRRAFPRTGIGFREYILHAAGDRRGQVRGRRDSIFLKLLPCARCSCSALPFATILKIRWNGPLGSMRPDW